MTIQKTELNHNLKKIVSNYQNIKCSVCLQKLNNTNINSFFILPKTDKGKYYCSKLCYNFI